ncbi:MAG: sensor histidine kinase [Rubrimonas sp.]
MLDGGGASDPIGGDSASAYVWRAILDQMPAGVTVARAPGGEILFQNMRAEALLGHGRIPADAVSDYARYGALDANDQPLPPEANPLARAVARGERVDREHVRYRRPDGAVIDLEVSAALVRDRAGAPLVAVASYEDVSERRAADAALAASEARLRSVLEFTSDGVFTVDHAWRVTFVNGRARKLIGEDRAIVGQSLWDAFPEAVGGPFWDAYHEAMQAGRTVRIEARYDPLGVTVEAAAHPFDGGLAVFFRDVTREREAEAAREALTREMAHRIGNLFALANSMIAMTARGAETPADMARRLSGRLMALAEAHRLAQPGDGAEGGGSLRALLTTLLSPYREGRAAIEILAPDMPVGPDATTALALIVHELATNAAKYGALADEGGRLTIEALTDEAADLLTLRWTETRSTPLTAPAGKGFGSALLSATARGRLGGAIAHDWRPEGLVVTVTAGLARCMR